MLGWLVAEEAQYLCHEQVWRCIERLMSGAGKFGHGCRGEGGGKFPCDLASPGRAGRANQEQHWLPDLADDAIQVGGSQHAGFAGQGCGGDGQHIPPAGCIAQRFDFPAGQADDVGEKGETARPIWP
jgi:hypothetical protein